QSARDSPETHFIFDGLEPGQHYIVGVIAVTPDGRRSGEITSQMETLTVAAPMTKESLLHIIYSYVPDAESTLIVLFAFGAAFGVARALKVPFREGVLLRRWR
ncbi:MAG: fibronectin type III domain-containing protein, partial [Candidatus Cloacimonetes bacterium]|nr:fibronectin type III domain-containing protein [Candidatus Cloacimonadota bacterium]